MARGAGGGRFAKIEKAAAPAYVSEVKSDFAKAAGRGAVGSVAKGGRFAKIEKAAPSSSGNAAPVSSFGGVAGTGKSTMAASSNKKDRFSYGTKKEVTPDAGVVAGAFDVGGKQMGMGASTGGRFKTAKSQGPVNESQAEVKQEFGAKAFTANVSPAMMKAKPRFDAVKEAVGSDNAALSSQFDKALNMESNMVDKRVNKKDRGENWASSDHDKA